jgi:hypothetical protein
MGIGVQVKPGAGVLVDPPAGRGTENILAPHSSGLGKIDSVLKMSTTVHTRKKQGTVRVWTRMRF